VSEVQDSQLNSELVDVAELANEAVELTGFATEPVEVTELVTEPVNLTEQDGFFDMNEPEQVEVSPQTHRGHRASISLTNPLYVNSAKRKSSANKFSHTPKQKRKSSPKQKKNVRHQLLIDALEDIDGTDEPVDLVVLPPMNQSGDTDEEHFDEDILISRSNDLLNIPEIAGHVEVQYGRLDEGDDLDDENNTVAEPSDGNDAVQLQEKLRSTYQNKDLSLIEKVHGLTKLTKDVAGGLDWKTLTDEDTFCSLPTSQELSPDQVIARDNIIDTFSGLTPVDSFERIFDEEVQNLIMNETNRYARTKHGDTLFDLKPIQLKKFLGILLFSGYHSLPRQRMYWELGEDIETTIVSSAMPRRDFEKIKRYLHVADNDNLMENTKFGKVMPLYDVANKKFKRFGPFFKALSIDEQMIPYFGRHSAKQTMRQKTVRFGYKNFVLTSSDGYPYHVIPYEGAKTGSCAMGTSGKDLTVRIVFELLLQFPESTEQRVSFDNWYASAGLVSTLGLLGIPCRATCRADRTGDAPFTPVTEMKKRLRGSTSKVASQGFMVAGVRWMDNSVVTVLSNCDKMAVADEVKRFNRKTKEHIKIKRVDAIKAYNEEMGGVDYLDRGISEYRIGIRGKKWWFPHFSNIVSTMMFAAFKLFKLGNPESSLDLLGFVRSLVLNYLRSDTRNSKKIGYRKASKANNYWRVPESTRYNIGAGHMPEKIDGYGTRCGVPECSSKSRLRCSQCRVAYCPGPCWLTAHGCN
jgi:hypothetical protein